MPHFRNNSIGAVCICADSEGWVDPKIKTMLTASSSSEARIVWVRRLPSPIYVDHPIVAVLNFEYV